MDAHVYALRSWTIKKKDLQRATTAIVRELQLEFVRRHNRVVEQ